MTTERRTGGRILIVDDEPLVLDIFRSVLSDEGYEVDEAGSAMEALLKLENNDYNLLLCDVRLNPFDGFDLAEIARKRHPELGVLLITGAPLDADSERARRMDVTYLLKPVGMEQLRAAVQLLHREVTRDVRGLVTLNCSLGIAYPALMLRSR